MSKLLKLLLCGVLVFNMNVGQTWASADDDDEDIEYVDDDEEYDDEDEDENDSVGVVQSVSVRLDCNGMKQKISELSASELEEDLAALGELQQTYRKLCAVKSKVSRAGQNPGSSINKILTARGAATETADANADAAGEKIVVNEKGVVATNRRAGSINMKKLGANMAPKDSVKISETVVLSDAQQDMCKKLPGKIKTAQDDAATVLMETYEKYCVGKVVAPDAVINTTVLLMGPDETAEEKEARQVANLEAGLCADGAKPNKFGCCGNEKFKDLGNAQFACCPDDGGDCYPPIQ